MLERRRRTAVWLISRRVDQPWIQSLLCLERIEWSVYAPLTMATPGSLSGIARPTIALRRKLGILGKSVV